MKKSVSSTLEECLTAQMSLIDILEKKLRSLKEAQFLGLKLIRNTQIELKSAVFTRETLLLEAERAQRCK